MAALQTTLSLFDGCTISRSKRWTVLVLLGNVNPEGDAMWESLGFRESPYNTSPLASRPEDVELLVGRTDEATALITNLGTAHNGVLVLSGAPGVGKTSFLNIQQYRLEAGLAPFGPTVLSARQLCPVQPGDDVRKISIRGLDSLCKSVVAWCSANNASVPSETKKVLKWLSGAGASGIDVGISILGCGGSFGRDVDLPKLADASFEAITDAVAAVSAEAVASLGVDSCVIALDNLENLTEPELGTMLISFRDTLFSVPGVWWVLIGQSGLGSLIQSLDSRVFERLTGSGIEIRPVPFEELDEAIALRVGRFHASGAGKSPLSTDTHRRLFDASFGEMRFVFKYSNSICAKFVENLRSSVLDDLPGGLKSKDSVQRAVDEAIAKVMINDQIPDRIAEGYLRRIATDELAGLQLKPKELAALRTIGEHGGARASDYKVFGLKSMQDFSSNYLTKLYHQNLLVREQEGRAVNYRLRGVAQLAYVYGLLEPTKTEAK